MELFLSPSSSPRRHQDSGNVRLPTSEWDAGIEMAAQAGIQRWMYKTYTSLSGNSENGSPFENAVIMTLASGQRSSGFTFFKYNPSSCNQHRYAGEQYIDSSKIVAGSSCTGGFSHSGKYLWGEHPWCGTSWTGQLWFFGCASPYSTSHLLIVNHDHGDQETRVHTASGYQNSNNAFEMFYSDVL